LALLSAATLAYKAPTSAERQKVKVWDDLMKTYGRDYEIHTVTTDDQWDLTLFRLMADLSAPKNDTFKANNERSVLI